MKKKKVVEKEYKKESPLKEAKKDIMIKEKEVVEEVIETIQPPKLFTTTSQALAQRLEVEGLFTYKSIGVDSSDPQNEIKTFTFNATEKEVQDFLNGRK